MSFAQTKKNNLLHFQNQRYVGIFTSQKKRERDEEKEREKERERAREKDKEKDN
jgi:hypothetical protein